MTVKDALYELNFALGEIFDQVFYDDKPYEFDKDEYEALDMAIESLKQNQWIPCEERLPEKDGNYLVCHTICGKTTAVDIAGYAKNLRKVDKYDFTKNKSGWYQYDSEYGYYETDGINAWMPLPKPWKGEQNESD